MQIILSQEEITIIHEALITEKILMEDQKKLSEFKGNGEYESKQIESIEALQERFNPYMKG